MIRSVRRGLYDSKRPTFERDSVGCSPDGTIVPAHYPRFTPGNYALEFGGEPSQRCSYKNIPTFNTFTLETWACPKEEDGNIEGIVSINKHDPSPRKGVNLSYLNRDNLFRVQYATEVERSSLNGPTGVTEYKWYHLATTYDGTTLKLYIDGELVNSLDPNGPIVFDVQHDLDIGHWSSTYRGYPFKGIVDEVRYWNYARTEQDIRDNMRKRILKAPGLVARYGFDEGSGDIAYDTSGNGYHGTIHGAKYTDHTPIRPYGKSLMIEEGTTNLCNTNFSTWSRVRAIREIYPDGSVKVTNDDYTIPRLRSPVIPVEEGQVVTASISVKEVSGNGTPRLSIYTDDGQYLPDPAGTATPEPGRYSLTATIPAGVSSVEVWVRPDSNLPPSGSREWVVVSDPQFEIKPYSTSFTVGTRAPERLEIPTDGVINPEEGQVDIDIDDLSILGIGEGDRYIIDTANNQNTANVNRNIRLYMTSGTNIRIRMGTITSVITHTTNVDSFLEGPGRISLRYSRNLGIRVSINGIPVISGADSVGYDLSQLGDSLKIGSRVGMVGYSNITVNGFRIRSRAMTDQEIAEEYEAGPLRPDALTTYFLPFNGDLDTSQMVKRVPRWRGYSGVTL